MSILPLSRRCAISYQCLGCCSERAHDKRRGSTGAVSTGLATATGKTAAPRWPPGSFAEHRSRAVSGWLPGGRGGLRANKSVGSLRIAGREAVRCIFAGQARPPMRRWPAAASLCCFPRLYSRRLALFAHTCRRLSPSSVPSVPLKVSSSHHRFLTSSPRAVCAEGSPYPLAARQCTPSTASMVNITCVESSSQSSRATDPLLQVRTAVRS